MGKRFYGGPKSYASFSCCASETTFKIVQERTQSLQEIRESHTHGLDAGELAKNSHDTGRGIIGKELALDVEQWERYNAWHPPRRGGYSADSPVTFEALRHKKSRLAKTAKVIVKLHGNRARFLTITCRENITGKKQFLYELENIRKALKAAGIVIKYSGMLERQERGAWHLHCLAYTLDHGWDYVKIQKIAVSRGFNFDFRRLGKAKRTSKKISDYMAKLEAVAIAAYESKDADTGDVHCYTLTAKGCDLPAGRKMYDPQKEWDFIQGKGFEKKDHNGFIYYLTENEEFSLEFYKNGFSGFYGSS